MLKLLADPAGREYFGCSLWRVADADALRYQVCYEVALATYSRVYGRPPPGRGSDGR